MNVKTGEFFTSGEVEKIMKKMIYHTIQYQPRPKRIHRKGGHIMTYGSPANKDHKPVHIHTGKGVLSPWRWRVVYIGYIVLAVIMAVLMITAMGTGADGRPIEPDLKVLAPVADEAWTVEAPTEIRTASTAQVMPSAAPSPEAVNTPSRDGSGGREPVPMECTAYTLREEECGKAPGTPGYGITASGAHVEPWHTIAAPRSIPYGTRIYIPYFSDMPNEGVFTVQDRGGAITEGHLDIYMVRYGDAMDFGRRELDVYILGVE